MLTFVVCFAVRDEGVADSNPAAPTKIRRGGVVGVRPDRSKPLTASATNLATETEAAAKCSAKFAGIS
jgi:hypothetical protein